jgi:lipopolysaccharide transport protein LptA
VKIHHLSLIVAALSFFNSAFSETNSVETLSSTNVVETTGVGNRTEKKAVKKSKRPARITSSSTYFDRKEGVGIFEGRIHVDDEEYQLHADKAFVFMQGTNELKRIVAIGNVAITNEMRSAYGAKASYYRDSGMVVLYSGTNILAEVREVKKDGDQIVKGSKIKFWINSEQVEVIDADISAPSDGGGGIKSLGVIK